jgi:hypothetical protein
VVKVTAYLGEGSDRVSLPYSFETKEKAFKYLVKAKSTANEKKLVFDFDFENEGK